MTGLIDEVTARAALPPPDRRRAILKSAGVTISRLALDLGRNRITVSRWISGSRCPHGVDLVVLSTRLAEIEEVLMRSAE